MAGGCGRIGVDRFKVAGGHEGIGKVTAEAG